MTLDELLRSRCHDPSDAIQRTTQALDEAQKNRLAALDRARRAREESDRLRGASVERQSTARTIQSQIADLEDQLQKLRSRIEARQRELMECLDAQTEVGRRVAEQRKLDRTDSQLAESLAAEISEAERTLGRERARLRDARRTALADYLICLWSRMEEVFAAHEDSKVAMEARRRLDTQRHEDPELAGLWEAREEWRRILQTAGPTLVTKTARAELDRIEADIELRFPGALGATAINQRLSEIEELFVASRPGGLRSWIPLPIPPEVWRALERGDRGPAEDLAMRLIWAFARALPPSKHRGVFFAGDLCCGFATDSPEHELTQIESVLLSLPSGASVTFILSSLPPEVADVVAQDLDE